MTTLRDELEQLLRAWDAHEIGRGAHPIIDFDFAPQSMPVTPATDRLGVHEKLIRLQEAALEAKDNHLIPRIRSDIHYLAALLGEREPLGSYIEATLGCPAAGWSRSVLEAQREKTHASLAALGIGWGKTTDADLAELEGSVPLPDIPDAIRSAADHFEQPVRTLTGSSAPFDLSIEVVDVDAYWTFWLDGRGTQVRLRLNRKHASFTATLARQFALHEVLGHGLQSASIADRCAQQRVPWVRLLSVHTPQQVLFEGLAQALPLFVAPDDVQLINRVTLSTYTQLINSEMHLRINAGQSVRECADFAHEWIPWWSAARIGNGLSDRGSNPLLRSYLWSYPAGIHWFVSLASADPATISTVFQTAYRELLTPAGLAALWPDGPPIGGDAQEARQAF